MTRADNPPNPLVLVIWPAMAVQHLMRYANRTSPAPTATATAGAKHNQPKEHTAPVLVTVAIRENSTGECSKAVEMSGSFIRSPQRSVTHVSWRF